MRKKSWRTHATHLFELICVLCTLFVIFDTTREYMLYKTLTHVTREPIHTMRMPAVGICTSYNVTLTANTTILHRFLKMNKFDDILNECKVFDPEFFAVRNCDEISAVEEYTDSLMKCFTFFESRGMENRSLYIHRRLKDGEPILVINFTVPLTYTKPPLLVLYNNEHKLAMTRGGHNKAWLPQNARTEFAFTIEIETHILLPAPFSSDCRDFRLTEYKTRENALQKCMQKHFYVDDQRMQPMFSFADRDDSLIDLSISSVKEKKEETAILHANAICDTLIGDDNCYSIDYKVIPVSMRPGQTDQSSIKVRFAGIPSYSLRSELNPVYTLLDYLNWIGSIGNLWLAFTMIGLFCFTSDLILPKGKTYACKDVKSTKDKKKNKLTKVIKRGNRVICFLICLISACVQISDIVMIYIDKPFKFNYYTKLEKYLMFPSVVFCMDRVIDPYLLSLKFPHLLNNNMDQEKLKHTITVSDQMDLTIDAKEIFSSSKSKFVNTARESLDWSKISDYFVWQKYLNHEFVCFKTFSSSNRKNKTIEMKPLKRSLLELKQYFSIAMLLQKNVTKVIYMIIQMDSHFTNDGSFKLRNGNPQNLQYALSPDQKTQMNKFIFYEREVKVIYYPNHYRSECISYIQKLKKTRKQLVDGCFKKYIMNHLSNKSANVWPRDLFYSKSMSGMNMSRLKEQPLFFSPNDSLTEMLTNMCEKKYPIIDCEVFFVELSMEMTYRSPSKTEDIVFMLYPPGKGYLELRQELRFSLLGLFGFIGGTIGFWIGVAVLDIKQLFQLEWKWNRKSRVRDKKKRVTRPIKRWKKSVKKMRI